MALMVQEPGDEPRRPCTPLLAPFITNDVLLHVNNILAPLDDAHMAISASQPQQQRDLPVRRPLRGAAEHRRRHRSGRLQGFGRSLKVRIELEDEQPQDNFRLKAKRGGDNGGLWEVLLIHFEFFPTIPLSQCIPSTRTTRGLGPNSGACACMLVPVAAGRGG